MEVANQNSSPLSEYTLVLILASTFLTSSFFKMFSVHTKTQCQHFDQIYSLKNVWKKIRLSVESSCVFSPAKCGHWP